MISISLKTRSLKNELHPSVAKINERGKKRDDPPKKTTWQGKPDGRKGAGAEEFPFRFFSLAKFDNLLDTPVGPFPIHYASKRRPRERLTREGGGRSQNKLDEKQQTTWTKNSAHKPADFLVSTVAKHNKSQSETTPINK